MYIRVQDGIPKPYPIQKLKRDFPNISFPKKMTEEMLAAYDVFRLVPQDIEAFDRETHKISVGEIHQIDGVWTQLRSIVKISPDEAAKRNRHKRDQLLAETDYLALSDNTLTTEMTTYRQALRDITDHANFPYLEADDWPIKPE